MSARRRPTQQPTARFIVLRKTLVRGEISGYPCTWTGEQLSWSTHEYHASLFRSAADTAVAVRRTTKALGLPLGAFRVVKVEETVL